MTAFSWIDPGWMFTSRCTTAEIWVGLTAILSFAPAGLARSIARNSNAMAGFRPDSDTQRWARLTGSDCNWSSCWTSARNCSATIRRSWPL